MARLALIGVGKIARDQHLPAIRGETAFDLVATASPQESIPGIPAFPSLETLLADGLAVDAVAICTPPAVRHRLAAMAIDAGLHVMLEKPPAARVSQVADLTAQAQGRDTTLFAAWHSREAAGVAAARDWLAAQTIQAVRIDWREDVRRWHPGQEWIFATGGYGVFDPGINALSILTAILPDPPMLRDAVLWVPEGRGAPIAAHLSLASGTAPIDATFDFREAHDQRWSIEVDTAAGTLSLAEGGMVLRLPGEPARRGENEEYPRLYRRFATLIERGGSDADAAPLQLVADAFLIGRQQPTEPFTF